jgi:hypothetical protein
MEKITFTLTACGRPDLLEKTMDSFFKFNTYPIEKFKIIDDSTTKGVNDRLIEKYKEHNIEWIHNTERLGQTKSIDIMYSDIDTKYIFHCEDDWEFTKHGFIEKSIPILEEHSYIVLVGLRAHNDTNGQPIEIYNKDFDLMAMNFQGIWHGFTFNPGLRRLAEYLLVKPYESIGWETELSIEYKKLGYRAAILKDKHVEHIGWNRHIQDAAH